MKIKQFEQDLKKLCKKEVVVVTIGFYGRDHRSKKKNTVQQSFCMVVTTKHCLQQTLVWLQPQHSFVETEIFHLQCGRDHRFFLQQP